MGINDNVKIEPKQEICSDRGENNILRRKGLSKKALIGIAIAGAALVALCLVFLSHIFPTADSLIKQGKYEEAYEIANEGEKQEIAVGNIVAWCSAEVYESLNNTFSEPISFELIDAYYDGKINFILHVSYRGALGVRNNEYFYFKYMADGNISLFIAFSDLNEEESYSESASEDEKFEAVVRNAVVGSARAIVEDPTYKVKDIFIDEINTLIKNGELASVKLIPQAKDVIESNKNA